MAKLPPYAVLVRDMPTHRTFDVTPEQVSEWVKGLPMRDALGAPEVDPDAGSGHAELELYTDDGTHAFASGTFKGHVTVACSRCIEPVQLPINERVMVTFLPQSEMPTEEPKTGGEDGAEVSDAELDVFPFDGEKVDLEPLFREQFVLAIPFSPLCKEDCKGLCPQCGIDRNSATCTCEKPIDPRLAPLMGLKLPS